VPWYEYSVSPQGGQPFLTVRLWHGSRQVNVIALVDSGADSSLMDASYAELLGLDRSEAVISEATTAGGTTARVLQWPNKVLEIQFEDDRFPFKGSFVEFLRMLTRSTSLGGATSSSDTSSSSGTRPR